MDAPVHLVVDEAPSFAPQLVTAGPTRANQVVYGGQGPVLLFNRDPDTTVYLGDEGTDPGDSTVHILDPLGVLVFDGKADVWAITATGTGSAVVQCTPGGLSTQASPAEIALQIAETGIGSPIPAVVAAPVQVATVGNPFGPTSYTFPIGGAYQLVLSANNPANACMVDLVINHLDALGNVVYTEDYTVGLGALGNFSPVIVRGNLEGKTLQISGQLATGAQINAYGFATGPFTGTGLVMGVYSLGQSLSPPTPKIIPSNTTAGILGAFQAVSLGAGLSSGTVPLFAYLGTVKWDVFTATAANGRASIQFFKVATGTTAQSVFRIQNDGKVSDWEEVECIGMLGALQVTNEAAGTVSVTSHVIAKEFI